MRGTHFLEEPFHGLHSCQDSGKYCVFLSRFQNEARWQETNFKQSEFEGDRRDWSPEFPIRSQVNQSLDRSLSLEPDFAADFDLKPGYLMSIRLKIVGPLLSQFNDHSFPLDLCVV